MNERRIDTVEISTQVLTPLRLYATVCKCKVLEGLHPTATYHLLHDNSAASRTKKVVQLDRGEEKRTTCLITML